MDAVWTALLSATVALVASVAGTSWRLRSERRQQKEVQLEELLSRYREPLVRSAFELQSRLYNIVRQAFVSTNLESNREYVVHSTQWLLGQYLGWVEILRTEIQFLDLGTLDENRRLVDLQDSARSALSSLTFRSEPDHFRIFGADQKAIGEAMIDTSGERRECLGYAAFLERMTEADHPDHVNFINRFDPWERGIEALAETPGHPRLVKLQRALIDLIDFLDDDRSRFPLDQRGKLPIGEPLDPATAESAIQRQSQAPPHAHFRFGREPWAAVSDWADSRPRSYSERKLREEASDLASRTDDVPEDASRAGRSYLRPGSTSRGWIGVAWAKGTMQIRAEIVPRWPLRRPIRPEDRGWRTWSAKRVQRVVLTDLNVLLRMFDRPLIRRNPRRR